MSDMISSVNLNWVFDYALLDDIPDPTGDLGSVQNSGVLSEWPSHSFPGSATAAAAAATTSPISMEFDDIFNNSDSFKEIDDSFDNSDSLNETCFRKRIRSGSSCCASGSKACKEKLRRNRLNERFMELSSILDPGRPPKADKVIILIDAARMVTRLQNEVQKLKDSNQSLHETVNELKAEKNTLREEKLRLKTEKHNVEQKMKTLCSQPSFIPHPHPQPIPVQLSVPAHVVGAKLMPFVRYPGRSMWHFLPFTAVDTSRDPFLHPPVA